MMRYIGIDPGLTGAVAVIDRDNFAQVYDTPIAKMGTKNVFMVSEMVGLLRLLTTGHTVVAIESVHAMPKQGVTSSFNFGKGVGYWIGILAALGLPYDEVTPQRWQKEMMDGMQRDKDASRIRAMQLFPALSSSLALKSHHGRAEALLIAAWRMRQDS